VSEKTGAPYAPKWLHPKGGVRFGFGGMLVTFHGKCLKVQRAISSQVENDLAARVVQFDKEL
jgi:hypothetical protein